MPFFGTPSGGGTPGPPPLLAYHHDQPTASPLWLIVHGLSFRPAGVQVLDPDGNPVEGVVSHPIAGTTLIQFLIPRIPRTSMPVRP